MYNELTPEEAYIIERKGTERPFTGKYLSNKAEGTYTCKRCDAPLYYSEHKFESHCGWPSFDDEIPGAVKRVPDADGRRIEIVCANCAGHLGHVFTGERFTLKNTRHCVNSLSMNFVPEKLPALAEKVYFACGCFWSKEYLFQETEGVLATRVGYTGGTTEFPTTVQVTHGKSGHAEVVEVVYNPKVITFEDLAKLFFDAHNSTDVERQGENNTGKYRSGIFYFTENQRNTALRLKKYLRDKGYESVTQIEQASSFYVAAEKYQSYYKKKGEVPTLKSHQLFE